MFGLVGVLFFAMLGVDWAGDRAGGAGRVESAARDAAFVLLEDPGGDAEAEAAAVGELRAGVAVAEACEAVSSVQASRSGTGTGQEAAAAVSGCVLSSGWVFDSEVDVGAACGYTVPSWADGLDGVEAEPLVWCETRSR